MKEYSVKECPFFMGVFQEKPGNDFSPWAIIVQAENVKDAAAFIQKHDGQECFKFYEADSFSELKDNFEKLVGTKPSGAIAWRSAQTMKWIENGTC